MRTVSLLLLAFLITSCTTPPAERKRIDLAPVSFSELDGWHGDDHSKALKALLLSCPAISRKHQDNTAWKSACAAAKTANATGYSAREYFEEWFQPYAATSDGNNEGLFTGYYMPELRGSLKREGEFQTPIYEIPNDLLSADLGAFKAPLSGQRIVGKASGNKFVPYDNRASISAGSLNSRSKIIAWTNDPIGAFFMEVQGSGIIVLPNGDKLPVGYAATNGHSYTAIGKVLADRQELQRPITMPSIRAWLETHPDKAQSIMNENSSYIFFRRLPTTDAIGAQGIALTPERSLAVDRDYVDLGSPVWLDALDGTGAPLRRLVIAQDTGGAIKGPVRGDFYWGTGDSAAAQAGAMQSSGRYYILLPKGISPNER